MPTQTTRGGFFLLLTHAEYDLVVAHAYGNNTHCCGRLHDGGSGASETRTGRVLSRALSSVTYNTFSATRIHTYKKTAERRKEGKHRRCSSRLSKRSLEVDDFPPAD